MLYRSLLAVSLVAVGVGCKSRAPESASSMNLQQKASYLFGQKIGQTVKQLDLDEAALLKGIADVKAGRAPLITQAEEPQILGAYMQEIKSRDAKKGDSRKAANKAWLADNAKKPGVKTTASGLQYKVISSGKGKQPTAADVVTVNYKGSLIDGTVFDASEKHGGPATFPLGQVIKGWTEGLQLMHEGDKWEFCIPSELAYGENAPPTIGPNQVLIFEVELLKVGASK